MKADSASYDFSSCLQLEMQMAELSDHSESRTAMGDPVQINIY